MLDFAEDFDFCGERVMSEHAIPPRQEALGARGLWLTRGQIILQAVQHGLLAALLAGLLAFDYERTSLLFRDPLGRQMLTRALTLIAWGLVLHLVVSVVLNRVAPAGDPTFKRWRVAAAILFEAAHLGLFYLPAAFTFVVGPSAIVILQTMMRP